MLNSVGNITLYGCLVILGGLRKPVFQSTQYTRHKYERSHSVLIKDKEMLTYLNPEIQLVHEKEPQIRCPRIALHSKSKYTHNNYVNMCSV